MPVDPWAATVAQEFTTQEPDVFRRLGQTLASAKREMFDLRASVLANVSDIVAELRKRVDDLAALTAGLAVAVANIATLVANQTSAGGNAAYVGFATIPTGWGTAVSAAIPAPSWATKALVTVTGVTKAYASTGSVEILSRINIDGDLSVHFNGSGVTAGEHITTVPIHYRDYDPGATVNVSIEWVHSTGSLQAGSASARIVATAVFLR